MSEESGTKKLLRKCKRRFEEFRFAGVTDPVLAGRYQLPSLLNAWNLLGTGVEVGVYTGWFSNYLLEYWRGKKLISIDPWIHFEEGYRDDSNRKQAEMDELYRATKDLLYRYGERSEVWRLKSNEAALKVPNGSLDFVYIDAQHHEAAVTEDIAAWWPKVKEGGVLSGHDYMDGIYEYGEFGVKTAVDRFVKENGLRLHVTGEAASPSWFFVKPVVKR